MEVAVADLSDDFWFTNWCCVIAEVIFLLVKLVNYLLP